MKKFESLESFRSDVMIGLLGVCTLLLGAEAYLFFTRSPSVSLPQSGWGIFYSANVGTIFLSFFAGWIAVAVPKKPILLLPAIFIILAVYVQFLWAMLKLNNLMLFAAGIIGGFGYIWRRFVLPKQRPLEKSTES